jgi:aflatoxin B1 aldehyde reductase
MNFTSRFRSTSSMAPMRRFPSKKPTLQSKFSMKKDASKRLQIPNSHLPTLHLPDMFKQFGFSNFTREQVLEYYDHAKIHNLILPTIYQASYSPAVRRNETLLFPTLRELGISIQAYSPMAGGFLSRTASELTSPAKGGKWDPEMPVGKFYRTLFFKPSYLTFLEEWEKLVDESGVSRVGLAYRWVRYHSVLKGELGDEMIIGASSAKQFEEALIEIEKGPLEGWVVDRIEALWEGVKADAEVDHLRAFRAVFLGN